MLPISDILIRSISGYVFIIPVLILYFFNTKNIKIYNRKFLRFICKNDFRKYYKVKKGGLSD